MRRLPEFDTQVRLMFDRIKAASSPDQANAEEQRMITIARTNLFDAPVDGVAGPVTSVKARPGADPSQRP
jgi:hypothetical protein